MEVLRDNRTDELHLSVSFSGTGFSDIYVTQKVTLYRAVRITFKWFIIPRTVSRVLSRQGFLDRFGDLLSTDVVDREEFWVFKEHDESALRARIRELELDNSFRVTYRHAYLPDSA